MPLRESSSPVAMTFHLFANCSIIKFRILDVYKLQGVL